MTRSMRRSIFSPMGNAAEQGSKDPAIDPRSTGEVLRDLDQDNRKTVSLKISGPHRMMYTEPMELALPGEPKGGILALRVLDALATTTPVLCSPMVHFVWTGKVAKITKIDGLVSGTTYLFTFGVIG